MINEIKGNEMLFPTVLISFSVGTMGKTYHVCRKYSLRYFQTCHLKTSSDRRDGELIGVNIQSISSVKLVQNTSQEITGKSESLFKLHNTMSEEHFFLLLFLIAVEIRWNFGMFSAYRKDRKPDVRRKDDIFS